MEVRDASNAKDVKYYTTDRLREEFHIANLFTKDNIRMVYSHTDRIIVIGMKPVKLPLKLEGAVANDVLLLVAACDEISRTPSLDTDTMEKISHLLSCILLIMKDRVRQTEYSPLTLKIMQYLQSNFSERITLDDIGRLTFFSPNYCENVFKRETGRSVIDYLLQIRMEAAKRLLSEGSLSLGAVAETVGFDDYNYFSRVFKKRTGYTPTEYKKLISL